MRYNRNVDISAMLYADSSPSKHDDSHRLFQPAARNEFTGNVSSAASPLAVHHRTGYPMHRYSSQPHLYLVFIISLSTGVVNSFRKFYENKSERTVSMSIFTDTETELLKLKDEKYAEFQQKLTPTLGIEHFIGVRTP